MSRKGFTLVEVLITVVFLSVGTLIIQECFLRSASLYARHAHTLRARIWMNEKLWDARAGVLYEPQAVTGPEEGTFMSAGRRYHWAMNVDSLGSTLYTVQLKVDWTENGRTVWIEREVYAAKPKLL